MINLTGPLSSRRTEKKERDRKRERERKNLCRAIISSCVDYCLVEAKLKNAALAPRQPHRSSCSVSSTEWNSLLTKEDKFFFVRDLEARTRTNEIYSLSLCLLSFLSYLSLFSPCSPCVLRQGCRGANNTRLKHLCRRSSPAFFSSAPPPFRYSPPIRFAIHKRQATHRILSRFRV